MGDVQCIKLYEDDDIDYALIGSFDQSKPLKVVINSGGGSFQTSYDLKSCLSGFEHITVELPGMLCGTYFRVLTYADKIVASEKAQFHWMGARVVCYGSLDEMNRIADKVRAVDLELIKEFQDKFGINLDDIKDKWLSVSEMKTLGVPIEVIEMD